MDKLELKLINAMRKNLNLTEAWTIYENNKPRKPVDLEELLMGQQTNQQLRNDASFGKPVVVSNRTYDKVKEYCDSNNMNFNEVIDIALLKWITR